MLERTNDEEASDCEEVVDYPDNVPDFVHKPLARFELATGQLKDCLISSRAKHASCLVEVFVLHCRYASYGVHEVDYEDYPAETALIILTYQRLI